MGVDVQPGDLRAAAARRRRPPRRRLP
jgi:hypothetical protein